MVSQNEDLSSINVELTSQKQINSGVINKEYTDYGIILKTFYLQYNNNYFLYTYKFKPQHLICCTYYEKTFTDDVTIIISRMGNDSNEKCNEIQFEKKIVYNKKEYIRYHEWIMDKGCNPITIKNGAIVNNVNASRFDFDENYEIRCMAGYIPSVGSIRCSKKSKSNLMGWSHPIPTCDDNKVPTHTNGNSSPDNNNLMSNRHGQRQKNILNACTKNIRKRNGNQRQYLDTDEIPENIQTNDYRETENPQTMPKPQIEKEKPKTTLDQPIEVVKELTEKKINEPVDNEEETKEQIDEPVDTEAEMTTGDTYQPNEEKEKTRGEIYGLIKEKDYIRMANFGNVVVAIVYTIYIYFVK